MFYSKINQLLFHLQKSKLDLPGTRGEISTKRRPRLLSITRTFGAGIFKAQPCEETAILRQGWKDSNLLVIWFTWALGIQSNGTYLPPRKKALLIRFIDPLIIIPRRPLFLGICPGVGPVRFLWIVVKLDWTHPSLQGNQSSRTKRNTFLKTRKEPHEKHKMI